MKHPIHLSAALLGLSLFATNPLHAQDLPAPDGKPAEMTKAVQVFIVMGQSNTLEMGKVTDELKTDYPFLAADGGWSTRQDVRNVSVMVGKGLYRNEWLTVEGKKNIGIEVGIGHQLGNAIDAPVMVLKSSIGNRGLGWDLLPPGSPRYTYEGKEVAGYHEYEDGGKILPYEKGVSKVIGTKGKDKGKEVDPWYAGKQYDDDIANAKVILDDLGTHYPEATKYEIAGFIWWQGDKDRYNVAHAANYEKNLVTLIKALRKEFNAPNAPFVLGTLGQTAKDSKEGNDGLIFDAQMAVDGETGKYPEFKGNVATIYTNPLSMGGASNGHYGGNAKTYMNVGLGLGEAMAKLLKK